MDNQVLCKIDELKLHIDRRLDEIYSLLRSSHGDQSKEHLPISPVPANSKDFGFPPVANGTYNAGPIISCSGDLMNGNDDLLVDISPKQNATKQPEMKPTEVTKPVEVKQPETKPPEQPVLNGACNGYRSPSPNYAVEVADALNYIKVEFGRFIDINLSYVYSSRSFFVHLNYEEVENFYMKFNEHYATMTTVNDLNLSPNSISIHQLCCVFNQDDSSYYRAQILKDSEGKYLVRFVDFGDMYLVAPKFMYKLFPEFAKVPIFALHCFLEGIYFFKF